MTNLNLKNSSLQKVNLTTIYNKIIKMSKNYIQYTFCSSFTENKHSFVSKFVSLRSLYSH